MFRWGRPSEAGKTEAPWASARWQAGARSPQTPWRLRRAGRRGGSRSQRPPARARRPQTARRRSPAATRGCTRPSRGVNARRRSSVVFAPGDQNRDVVEGRRRPAKRKHVGEDRRAHLGGGGGPVLGEEVDQAGCAVGLVLLVDGVGHASRIGHEQVVGPKRHAALLQREVGQHPEEAAVGFQQLGQAAVAAKEQRLVLPGADVTQLARGGMEHAVEDGDEHLVVGRHFHDAAVHRQRDLRGRGALAGVRQEQRTRDGHEQRRVYDLVGHVGHEQADVLIVNFDHIVEVAAHVARRDIARGKVVAFYRGEPGGEQTALDLARDLHLALQLFLLHDFGLRGFELVVGFAQLLVLAGEVGDSCLVRGARVRRQTPDHGERHARAVHQKIVEDLLRDFEDGGFDQRGDGGRARLVLDEGHLAEKLARAAHRQHALLGRAKLFGDGHLPFGHDVEDVLEHALAAQEVTGGVRLHFRHTAEGFDFLVGHSFEGISDDGGGIGHERNPTRIWVTRQCSNRALATLHAWPTVYVWPGGVAGRGRAYGNARAPPTSERVYALWLACATMVSRTAWRLAVVLLQSGLAASSRAARQEAVAQPRSRPRGAAGVGADARARPTTATAARPA